MAVVFKPSASIDPLGGPMKFTDQIGRRSSCVHDTEVLGSEKTKLEGSAFLFGLMRVSETKVEMHSYRSSILTKRRGMRFLGVKFQQRHRLGLDQGDECKLTSR